MSEKNDFYKRFMEAVRGALENEDILLRKLISDFSGPDRIGCVLDPGILFISKPVYAFLIVKEILRTWGDYRLEWEVGYPGSRKNKLDLLLKPLSGGKAAAIELRVIDNERESTKKLEEDIERLSAFGEAEGGNGRIERMVCLVSIGSKSLEQRLELGRRKDIRIVFFGSFHTLGRGKAGETISREISLMMLVLK
jgi:hypothetical protein